MWRRIVRQLREVNQDLWLLLMLFSILAALNYLVDSDRMMLGFYILPTVFAAYFRGRRYAVVTALASIALVVLLVILNPRLMANAGPVRLVSEKWYDITIWGGTLVITAYAMGTLYEKNQERIRELSRTYKGVLHILQRFIARDDYTYLHSLYVVAYADKIAERMGFDTDRREVVKAAAMLHDIGKLDTSRELLYKAALYTESERAEMKKHVQKGADLVQPLGSILGRVIPVILAHHDRFDGSGYHPEMQGEEIPLEARVIAVADVFEAMTSPMRPHHTALSREEARNRIEELAGTEFDPVVVKAFLEAYDRGSLEIEFTSLKTMQL